MKKLINKIVANYYHLKPEQMFSKTRQREICEPRQVSIFLMLEFVTKNKSEIGRFYDLNHATIINAEKRIEDIAEFDKNLRADLLFLREKISAEIGKEDPKIELIKSTFKRHKNKYSNELLKDLLEINTHLIKLKNNGRNRILGKAYWSKGKTSQKRSVHTCRSTHQWNIRRKKSNWEHKRLRV